ncbi:hypothetical protein MRX96_040073 [Rhipicephalus microplus]
MWSKISSFVPLFGFREPVEEQSQVQAEHVHSEDPPVSPEESAPHPDTSLRRLSNSQTLDPDDPASESNQFQHVSPPKLKLQIAGQAHLAVGSTGHAFVRASSDRHAPEDREHAQKDFATAALPWIHHEPVPYLGQA